VLHIAIVSSDPRVEELLKPSGLTTQRFPRESWSARSIDGAPSALLLDVRGLPQLPAALTLFRRDYAGTPIVLITSSLDGQMMLEAMRAGVSECVVDPLTSQALDAALRRVIKDTDVSASQVFAFIGAKGGVGTSTLAVNTAASLARDNKGQVLLIDLHHSQGDAAIFLGAEPRFSVIDALENSHRLDEALFRSMVEQTKAGIDLLASSDRVLHAAVDSARTRALIEFVSRRYRYVVLDVPRSDVSTLDALESVSSLVLVASQEIGALKSAARMAQTFGHRYGSARVKFVVNRFDVNAEIGQAEIEKVVGVSAHLLPSDYRTAVDGLNAGRPVVLDKEQRISRAFRSFASELAGIAKPVREVRSGGMLSRLALRRA
jgi:pilus assembly protein CpaE